MKQYVIDRGCKFCMECMFACPSKAIYVVDNERVEIDQGRCRHCGRCYDNCSSEAISVYEVKEGADK